MNITFVTNKLIIGFMILLTFSFTGCTNSITMDSISVKPSDYVKGEEAAELKVQDYFPSKPVKKYFTGGFENGGFTHTFEKFEGDKVQVKQFDTAVGIALIYQISDEHIRKIYAGEMPDGKHDEDYIGKVQANSNDVILKGPLVVGTKWTNDKGDKYEISGVNVNVKTQAGTFNTVEVTVKYTGWDTVNKFYYAKDLGVVKSSIILDKGLIMDDLLIKIEK
jgi:hypothetical protein